MLNVKYYKDYRHNYLIIKCDVAEREETYQRKMLTANPIKGLLKCQERHVNGEVLLYYEITSRQSLVSIYGDKSIGLEMVHQFFMKLKLVDDALQKYLLDDRGLILCPEYIFCDLETGEFFFLYYPEGEENDLTRLMEFFMEKVDDNAPEAVETVYRIADLIHREQFVLDEVLEWLEDKVENCQNAEQEVFLQSQEETTHVDTVVWEESKGENTERVAVEKNKSPLFFLVGGLVSMGILFYVMHTYNFTYVGKLLLAAGWSVVVLLLAGAAFGYIRQIYGKKEGYRESILREVSYNKSNPVEYEMQNEQTADLGNTVFIPWTENCENRLYGMNKGNKYHIDLGNLPLTVGKLAGAVDMVINEQGISRMHARFSRVGKRICVTDLNSTNGTFKNGLRLQPNDSEMIEPGDEIRLGKLKFIYR